jgi:hypothetical protein
MIKKLQFIIPIMLWAGLSFAQNVEGVVKDSQGGAIVGATVVVKGTKIYAVTDTNGLRTARRAPGNNT